MAEITAVNDHIVDIKLDNIELACHTKERLKSNENNQDHHRKKPLICRVPKKFHEIDGSAYVPRRFPIGPYHNGSEHQKKMESNKLSILGEICKHFPATLEKYYGELQSLEEEARNYYSGDIPLNTQSFLDILLLDSCFILFSLKILNPGNSADSVRNSSNTGSNSQGNDGENLGAQYPNGSNHGYAGEENSEQNNVQPSGARTDESNPKIPSNSFLSDFTHDLFLFENQIPFFILERMYNVARGDETYNEHVASGLGNILKGFIQEIWETTIKDESPKEIHHLLHLLYLFLRPTEEQNGRSEVGRSWLITRLRLWLQWKPQTNNNKKEEKYKRWRRAVEYHDAGVHFKIPRQSSHSPLDIEFENGQLRIPKLIIDEKTSYIFGNLLAFEQHAQFENYITTYITFMSQLLSMPEDVTLLSRKGIIEHHLGCDEDVSELFKKLTKFRIVQLGPNSYLKAVWYGLEKHYRSHWNRWFAWLRHKHMTNPWLILGLVVAAIVAISAVVQAFCSVIPLVHGKHFKKT